MVKLMFIVCLAFFGLREALGHSYHLGGCPDIEPMQGFQMNRMLGIWYVIQKTSTGSSCITYNFTKTDEPGEYELVQVSQNFAIPMEHQYRYTGRITVPDPGVPGRMTIKFPLNVAGSATFTVFTTDYSTYAGIFTCQKLAFAHRQSATILSREKTLDKMYVDKIRSKLSQANIDPFDLSIVSQNNCPKGNDGYNINIDDDTFSVKSIAGVFRKAGEKLGDGVEYVAGGTKKIYNKVTGEVEEGADEVREGARYLGDRTRQDVNYAMNRGRQDVDYVNGRVREDVDNLNHRIRDDVEVFNDRARGAYARQEEDSRTVQPNYGWLP